MLSDFSRGHFEAVKDYEIAESTWSLELPVDSAVNTEDLKIDVDYEKCNFQISGTAKVKKTLFDGSTLTSSQEFQRKFQVF